MSGSSYWGGWSLQALHDLEPGAREGFWRATGQDPQFLAERSRPQPAGWCLIFVDLRPVSGTVSNPVLYVDHGAGFEEQDRIVLLRGCPDGPTQALVHFDRPVLRFRFDPSDQPGEFELLELRMQALQPAQAAWHLLRWERRDWGAASPIRFAEFLERARERCHADGEVGLIESMLASRSDATHPTRYLRWIGQAESQMSGLQRSGKVGVSVVLLPNPDPQDALDAYASVEDQLGEGDEVLISGALAARLHAPLSARTRVIDDAPGAFFGLAASSAVYVTWLGPGERLHAHALDVVACAIERGEGARLIYSDEDFLDDAGERRDPYFKPAWDPELLLGQDYPARSVVLERGFALECAQRVAGEAWLYAACLEAIDALDADAILHIPAITRHHLHPRGGLHAPLHADACALQMPMHAALSAWLDRREAGVALLTSPDTGLAKLEWPCETLHVDIVIPTRDRVDLLSTCVDSILANTQGPAFTVCILDNGSREEATLEYLQRVAGDARVRVIRHDVPFNYSAINNHAVSQGTGDIVVLLNNDIEVTDAGWLAELAGQAARPGMGAVGAMLLYPDGSIQHAGVILGVGTVAGGVAAHAHAHLPGDTPGYFGRALLPQSMSAVTAACLAVKREVFDAVGGLDPQLAVAFNDVDFCLRLRDAGYRNLWTPYARLVHHESASRGYEDTPEKQARFVGEVELMRQRWSEHFDNDPAYSPNMALSPKDFTIDPQRYAPLRSQ